jgi:23S rRNA pseudouridine1911/1915/1917 synthase
MSKSGIQVIYEDDDYLVVDKPSGVPVLPDRSKDALPDIRSTLEPVKGKLWVVHRIDRDTSGLLVMARNAEAHRHLNMQWEGRTVRKEYYAIVQGTPLENPAQIEVPILALPNKNISTVDPAGKPAVTLIKVEASFRHYSLLRIRLLTGRRHQIRVHMAYAGNPLMVDALYAAKEQFFLSEIKKKYKSSGEEQPLINRLTLHATLLEFEHPTEQRSFMVESPLPKDMAVVVKQLERWDAI